MLMLQCPARSQKASFSLAVGVMFCLICIKELKVVACKSIYFYIAVNTRVRSGFTNINVLSSDMTPSYLLK